MHLQLESCIILLFALIFTKYFKSFLSEIFSFVGGLGLTIVDILSDSDKIFVSSYSWKDCWVYLFLFSAFFLLLGIILSVIRNKKTEGLKELQASNRSLQRKIDRIRKDYFRLCSDEVKLIFEDFFNYPDSRISIYQHHDTYFTLLGRFSNNSKFNNNDGHLYPESEGFIAKGWQKNEFENQDAPIWERKGIKYKAYMKSICEISDKRLDLMKMKICSFYIKTINYTSTSENPDGIIVFERLQPKSIDVNYCKDKMRLKNTEILSFLRNMKSLTKNLEN